MGIVHGDVQAVATLLNSADTALKIDTKGNVCLKAVCA